MYDTITIPNCFRIKCRCPRIIFNCIRLNHSLLLIKVKWTRFIKCTTFVVLCSKSLNIRCHVVCLFFPSKRDVRIHRPVLNKIQDYFSCKCHVTECQASDIWTRFQKKRTTHCASSKNRLSIRARWRRTVPRATIHNTITQSPAL